MRKYRQGIFKHYDPFYLQSNFVPFSPIDNHINSFFNKNPGNTGKDITRKVAK